ncbi:MAG: hypothetical protein KGH78_04150 [Candidatus Micrarchaeota archaeon]|nr:hypothetical protein [Candidatus Micrarchaeota archaeon]
MEAKIYERKPDFGKLVSGIAQSRDKFAMEWNARDLKEAIRFGLGSGCKSEIAAMVPELIALARASAAPFAFSEIIEALSEVGIDEQKVSADVVGFLAETATMKDAAPYNREYATRLLRGFARMPQFEKEVSATLLKVSKDDAERWVRESATIRLNEIASLKKAVKA